MTKAMADSTDHNGRHNCSELHSINYILLFDYLFLSLIRF